MKTKFFLILFILLCGVAGFYVFQSISLSDLKVEGFRSKMGQTKSEAK